MTERLQRHIIVMQEDEHEGLLADNAGLVNIYGIKRGTQLSFKGENIKFAENINPKEHVVLCDLKAGYPIIELGVIIGYAKNDLKAGTRLDPSPIGNMVHDINYSEVPHFCHLKKGPKVDSNLEKRTFEGYRRSGLFKRESAGIENKVGIINTVKCSEVAANNIAALARKKILPEFKNITDVISITHPFGCGMSPGPEKDELIMLIRTILKNPNFGAFYVIGLGCEHICVREGVEGSVLGELQEDFPEFSNRIKFSSLQKWDDELNAINQIICEDDFNSCFEYANKFCREELPLSYLSIGLKCGGSDVWSCVVNAALGIAADKIIHSGGSAIITEVPEMEGFLHVFAQRARTQEIGEKIWKLTDDFARICKSYPIPSEGRQVLSPAQYEGGLLNIFRKAAGACLKAGNSDIVGILNYGESIYDQNESGLFILEGPGYDPIAVTSLGISGSQLSVFTTGLGTPLGSALGKVIKAGTYSGSTGLKNQLDILADDVLCGDKTIDQLGEELYGLILDVASGRTVTAVEILNKKLKENGLPNEHNEFMLWKRWGDH